MNFFHFSLSLLMDLSFSLFFLLSFHFLCVIQKPNQIVSLWGKDMNQDGTFLVKDERGRLGLADN